MCFVWLDEARRKKILPGLPKFIGQDWRPGFWSKSNLLWYVTLYHHCLYNNNKDQISKSLQTSPTFNHLFFCPLSSFPENVVIIRCWYSQLLYLKLQYREYCIAFRLRQLRDRRAAIVLVGPRRVSWRLPTYSNCTIVHLVVASFWSSTALHLSFSAQNCGRRWFRMRRAGLGRKQMRSSFCWKPLMISLTSVS